MKHLRKSFFLCFAVIISAMSIFLSGCNFDGGLSVTGYVEQVNGNIHEAVNLTRQYRKLNESLDTRSPDDAENAIELLDQLSECYNNILSLQAPDRYNDIDDGLKKYSSEALADVSQLKSLISNSQSTGNDKMYKTDSKRIFEHYDAVYNELIDLNSQTRTRYRND